MPTHTRSNHHHAVVQFADLEASLRGLANDLEQCGWTAKADQSRFIAGEIRRLSRYFRSHFDIRNLPEAIRITE